MTDMNFSAPTAYRFSTKLALHGAIACLFGIGSVSLAQPLVALHPLTIIWPVIVVVMTLLACEPVRRATQPHRFGPANRVTMGRSILVGFVAAFLGSPGTTEQATWASSVAFIALLLDGLDGSIARRTSSQSSYGAQFDMELDSLMMLILCGLAWTWDRAGMWVLFCGLARYGWMATALLTPWFRRPLNDSFRRKTACVIGVLGLIGAIGPWTSTTAPTMLAIIATATLAVSFGIDALWLFRHRTEPLQ
jgi:phosphatidylglycerophosphate synthase